ncbi:hypothetical protein Tco_1449677 [Tanacetum coccineum]
MVASFTSSFRREVRGGAESLQLTQILDLLGTVILSNMEDRWIWDLNGDGEFCVKDVRNLLVVTFPSEVFLLRGVAVDILGVNSVLEGVLCYSELGEYLELLKSNSFSANVTTV